MNNKLYDRIDNMYMDGITVDDLSIDTKVAVVSDFFDKIEKYQ